MPLHTARPCVVTLLVGRPRRVMATGVASATAAAASAAVRMRRRVMVRAVRSPGLVLVVRAPAAMRRRPRVAVADVP